MGNFELIFFVSSLLKISLLMPFLVFYIISRRTSKSYKKKESSHYFLKIGLILNITLILLIIISNSIGFFLPAPDFINENIETIVYLPQILLNIFLVLSNLFLLIGIYKLGSIRIKLFNFLSQIFLFIILMSFYNMNITNNLLLFFVLLGYQVGMYLLSYGFLLMGYKLIKIKINNNWFAFITSLGIMIDPILCTYSYVNLSLNFTFQGLNLFWKHRLIAYIIDAILITCILIPISSLFKAIIKNKKIEISKKDKGTTLILKDYVNSIDLILGSSAIYILKEILKIDNLIYNDFVKGKIKEEQVIKILKLLIDEYYISIGRISYKLLNNLKNEKNSYLIEKILINKSF